MRIVFEGIKSGGIKNLCVKYNINQITYYKWRDKVFQSGDKIFSSHKDKESERLREQNKKLKETIGELTLELKKNDW